MFYTHLLVLLGIAVLRLEPCTAFPSGASQAGDVDKETVQAELLRTRQPVIISKTDPEGQLHTVTYSLTPDGQGISRAYSIELKPTLLSSQHANLQMSPKPAAGEATQPSSNPENDWEWAPATRTATRTQSFGGATPFDFGEGFRPSLFGNRQPATRTFVSSGGLPRPWNNPDWFSKPDFELPAGVTPKTTTKTEVDDQGRTVTTTTKVYRTSTSDSWPDIFGYGNRPAIPSLTPQNPSNRPSSQTPTDFEDWPNWFNHRHGLFDDLEPSAHVPMPRPLPLPTRTPSLLTTTPASQTTRPTQRRVPTSRLPTPTPNTAEMKTTTMLPSLDDFLKQQYGPGVSTTRHRLEDFTTTTPRTLATINIDELPTPDTNTKTSVKTPTNQPIDDDWLRSLDSSFIQPSNSHTKVTSISRTYNSAAPPSLNDLEPRLRDVLIRAGISDIDIQNAQDGTVTRTRTEPDGREIQTTFRVRTKPRSGSFPHMLGPHLSDVPNSSRNPNAEPTTSSGHKAERSLTDNGLDSVNENVNNEIDLFLAKVNLTPSDILAQNGEVIKTIVDKNDGRVLSVSFVLSTVKGDEQHPEQLEQQSPNK